jgi:VanZ family protein
MLRLLPPLLLMGLIFFLSAQPDLNSGFGIYDTIGRKLLHAATYGTLFLLWWRALGWPESPLAAAAITLLYAISDEWHQTFVEGRHGSALDVAIDASGMLIAYGLATRGSRAARRPRAGGRPPAAARRP